MVGFDPRDSLLPVRGRRHFPYTQPHTQAPPYSVHSIPYIGAAIFRTLKPYTGATIFRTLNATYEPPY